MPTYEYRCAKCGNHLEVFQSFTEEPLKKHDECGGKLAKVLSPAGIVLKGSGFYKTDNRSGATSSSKSNDTGKTETGSSGSGSSESSGSSGSNPDSKSDSKSSDSKSKRTASDAKSA